MCVAATLLVWQRREYIYGYEDLIKECTRKKPGGQEVRLCVMGS